MAEEAIIWVVVPRAWSFNNEYYYPRNYDRPEACFTLKELAEEWADHKSIEDFRAIAVEPKFDGYLPMDNCNSPLYKYEKDDVKKFCLKWGIDPEEYFIEKDNLKRMSDAKILELMSLIKLKFYAVLPVRIYC